MFRRHAWGLNIFSPSIIIVARILTRTLSIPKIGPKREQFLSAVDAEPLTRYRTGGYNPVHIGDTFDAGRYKVIHKLGWGGWSTVWLAIDLRHARRVAIKIMVAEDSGKPCESETLNLLSQSRPSAPGYKRIQQLLDHFSLSGPNGSHSCLVLEPLGPTVASVAESYRSGRLPGAMALEMSRQVADGLEYMHDCGFAHGDLHTGNIVFAAGTSMTLSTTDDLMKRLGAPELGDITSTSGKGITEALPHYLVHPVTLPPDLRSVKIIDFGQSFLHGQPREIRCPLVYRAPETLLTSSWDYEIDVWMFGCMLFELVVGYPPFDNILPDRDGLLREWQHMFGEWPEAWKKECPHVERPEDEPDNRPLETWLRETYFDGDKKIDFSKPQIRLLASLLSSMLTYEPSQRPSISEVRRHPWFDLDLPNTLSTS